MVFAKKGVANYTGILLQMDPIALKSESAGTKCVPFFELHQEVVIFKSW
jgi:hypothetical protein